MRTVTACGCALVSVAECCPDQAAHVNAICKAATERRVIFAQDNVLGPILGSERPLHRPHERLGDGGDARQELERHAGKRYRRCVSTTIADRLAQMANTSTLRLTHYGRRSGKPYEVTIWFMVEGEVVYLATANRKRQWPRNVAARPEVKLRIGSEIFTGRVEVIADRATIEHVTDLLAAKYWYTRPYVALARLLGWQVPSAAFRVSELT